MSEQFVSSTSSETTVGPRVFISYARSDGEQFATALRRALQRQNIPLWQDRVAMEGGRDWWLQIEEALNKVKFMVMVMTPNALTSPIVKKEWRYARQRGVCVYPVKGAPNLDFASLPRWMRDAHFYDLGYNLDALHEGPEWETFIRHLNGSCTVPRVPFMAEDLPSDFVMRAEEFDRIVSALLDEQRENPVAITAALRGAGGYGKTTLAMAICHNERLQEAFDDGILWVTLGEKVSESDLISRVNNLILVLSGELSKATELHILTLQFAELLAERDILLVIDDVWQPEHLKPFLHGGKRCARLITTRLSETLPERAQEFAVDAMKPAEATQLLAANLPNLPFDALNAAEREALRKLAERLGEWALLLKLTNGVLRDCMKNGQPLLEAIAYVNTALDEEGFTAFDARNSEERNRAVATSLGVSLKLLSEEERKRFEELAIFPEDVDVPLVAVHRLWQATAGMNAFYHVEKLCKRMESLSLLRLDLGARWLRLHDAIRHYLHFQIRSREGGAPALHSKFLGAYGVENWADLPRDEPYLWDHLAYHLLAADRRAKLRAALLDYRYLQAKLDARDVNAALSDFRAFLRGGDDKPVRMVRQAVEMSAHVLTEDKAALAHQLYGRLYAHKELAEIAALRAGLTANMPLQPLGEPTHLQAGGHLLRTLRGHQGKVRGALELRDGRLLSWSADKTLRLWAADGTERAVLRGHEGEVRGALELRDGRLLSWSEDKTLRLWAADGTERAVLRGHKRWVRGALELRDGRLLSWAEDKTLRLWAADGTELAVLRGHEHWVNGALELRDGRLLSWALDKTLRLWAADGTEQAVLRGHEREVSGALELRDGRLLSWSGGVLSDKTLRLWAADGTERAVLRGHRGVVRGALELRDGRLLSWSDDETLRLWAADGTERAVLRGHRGVVRGARELRDGRLLSWSADTTLRLWAADGTEIAVLRGHHEGSMEGARELRDGRLLSWSDKTLRLWAADGTELAVLRGHEDWVYGALELRDGRLLSWSEDTTLRLWAADGAETVLRGHEAKVSGARELRDGRLLSWSLDDTLRLWAADGTALAVLRGHKHWVSGALELRDGRLLSWSRDRTLRLWAADGTEQAVLLGHEDAVRGARELRDGRLLSWSADKTLRLWAADGTELAVLRGHRDKVLGALELRDGRLLSWAEYDTTLRLWAADGTALKVLRGHEGVVSGALELQDGRLLSWSLDDTLRLWAADGTEIAVLLGHRNKVLGALELRDGRLLSWAEYDTTLRLWAADGTPLGAIQQVASFSELRAWFVEHGADWGTFIEDWCALAPERGLLAWRHGAALHLCRAETGEELARFYAESAITVARFLQGGAVVALGCENGQVIFLKVNL